MSISQSLTQLFTAHFSCLSHFITLFNCLFLASITFSFSPHLIENTRQQNLAVAISFCSLVKKCTAEKKSRNANVRKNYLICLCFKLICNTYSRSLFVSGITKQQTMYHFPSQPGKCTFSQLQKISKFISQSGERFSNPLKQNFIPRHPGLRIYDI